MKMTLTHKPVVLGAVALVTLAACGGGGGGTDGGGGGGGGGATFSDDIAFGDITSTDSANLIVLSLDASADANISAVTSETGTLNRQGNTLSFGSVSGTISDDRTSVDLANGLITLDGDAVNFAARFDAAQGDINTLGIVGVASQTADLPSVSVTYTGDTVLTVVSGTDVYDLTGTAAITADFGAATQSVTTELTGLSGTRQPATGGGHSRCIQRWFLGDCRIHHQRFHLQRRNSDVGFTRILPVGRSAYGPGRRVLWPCRR